MSEPLVFSDTYGIREGKAEDLEKVLHEIVDVLEANPTRHLYFAFFIDNYGTEYSNLQIHPDPESMVEHMQLVATFIQKAVDLLDFTVGHEELFGTPNDALLKQLEQWGTVINRPAAGFTRLGQSGKSRSVSEPLVFLNSYTLAEGAADDYRTALAESSSGEAQHPGCLHDKVYLSEDGTRATTVQVHTDVRSMESQMRSISDRLGAVTHLIDADTMHVQLVGSPSAALTDGLREVLGPSVALTVKTPSLGFSRLPTV